MQAAPCPSRPSQVEVMPLRLSREDGSAREGHTASGVPGKMRRAGRQGAAGEGRAAECQGAVCGSLMEAPLEERVMGARSPGGKK